MLQETVEREEIIERVAALDIGKAELTCCVRVPAEGRRGRRLQEVTTYSTARQRQETADLRRAVRLLGRGGQRSRRSGGMRMSAHRAAVFLGHNCSARRDFVNRGP